MKPGTKIIVMICWMVAASVTDLFSADSIRFNLQEISVFQDPNSCYSKVLVMDYASHVIKNPEVWDNAYQQKKIYRVDIVYTRYPLHRKDWITPYDSLLNRRVRAICKLEPGIDIKKVTWNLMLQTNCRTESDAKNLFHGVVLWYKETPKEVLSFREEFLKSIPERAPEVRASDDVRELMSGSYQFPDSSVFKILARNPQWENMLIVSDWTSSMYQYGAQAVQWHRLNMDKNLISSFVFFNDGDRKKVKQKGKTGGIYYARPGNIREIMQVMEKVQRNGNGGDTPENDIEALLNATRKIKGYNEVILIADNHSPVKDISLLKDLKVPVRVIVCGCRKGETIRHDYLQIASTTDGSIHTMEEDLFNLSDIKEGEVVTIMDIPYQRTHGRIIKTRIKNAKAQL